MVAVVIGLVLATAGAGTASARAAQPCGSYPGPGRPLRPGAVSAAAQYQVLRRAQRPFDRVALSRLGVLPEAQILPDATRYLGPLAQGGRAYLVAALHLLPSTLEPVRCVPASQRSLQQALLPSLRVEYAHRGLCLVIVYPTRAAPTCEPAPGTVAPFLIGPGAPGLGLAPDGVPDVSVQFLPRTHAAIRVAVHENFWHLNDPGLGITPCGLNWIDATGIVLRAVTSCVADTT